MSNNENQKRDIINRQKAIPARKETALAVRGAENARPAVKKIRNQNRTPLPYKTIIAAVIVTVFALVAIMNFAQIDNYNSEIADLKDQLTDLRTEAAMLNQQLDKKDDLVYFEEYAKDTLGMVKASDLPHINITMQEEDGGEITRYEDKASGIGTLLSGLGEVFRSFLQ